MRPAPGPLTVGQGGASEQRHTFTGIHPEPPTQTHTSTGHKRTQTQAVSGTPPLAALGSGTPSQGMSHSPKPGLTLQSAWPGPSLPLGLPPSNESRQETDLRAPKAKISACQSLLLSVNRAFCLTFIHSIFVFHLFICSLTHSTNKDVKQIITFRLITWLPSWPPGLLAWGCNCWEGRKGGSGL